MKPIAILSACLTGMLTTAMAMANGFGRPDVDYARLLLSERTRAALDAYAAGVNAWVEENSPPPEYAALELSRFAPWTAFDSVTVSKVVSFSLSFSTDDLDRTEAFLKYQGVGDAAGFDGNTLFHQDTHRSAPSFPAATVPDASSRSDHPHHEHRKKRHGYGYARHDLRKAATLAQFDPFFMPDGLPRPGSNDALTALRHLLDSFETHGGRGESGLDFFALSDAAVAADRRDAVVLQSLDDALETLASDDFAEAFGNSPNQDDYRRGMLHRVVLASVLGGPFDIPPAGGAFPPPLPGLAGIPTDGGLDTVDAATHDSRAAHGEAFRFRTGPANRYVAELRFPGFVESESVWPGGSSGVIGNPFFANLLPLWLGNETVPLLTGRHEIRRNASSIRVFLARQVVPGATSTAPRRRSTRRRRAS